jgi:aldehyde dehydrogenase (NAD+)
MPKVSPDPVLEPTVLAEALSGCHYIGGRLVPAVSENTFPVLNPATGEEIARAAEGEAADVDVAVAAAAEAQRGWARRTPRERGKLLIEAARALETHTEELARLVALETGKAIRTESRLEAGVLTEAFTWYGGLATEIKGETIPFNPQMLAYTVREPVGVVGAIIPWNAPMLLMALKVAPALAAGNTVVVKSSEEAPLAVLRVCEILGRVLPPGTFNILSGFGPACGSPLAAHPKVRKVSFTGSVATGRKVNALAADRLVPATMELGGKSPMIVMADADLDKTVEGAVSGMRFTRQGQSCTAASRIYVHDDLHDAFIERLKARVDAMVMGDPLDEKTDIGTIISTAQYEKVKHYIAMGREAEGAVAHVCSKLPTDPRFEKGLFVQPVIFTGMPADAPPAREEIFGPVTCVFRWTDRDAVIAAANDSEYGLAGTVWTRDLHAALDTVHRLEVGFVQVNQNLVVTPQLSYGGVKQSGLGREASFEAMLDHFTQKKTIIVNMGG